MNIKYIKNNTYKSLFFIFHFHNTLAKKVIFFQLEIFVDKTTFDFH